VPHIRALEQRDSFVRAQRPVELTVPNVDGKNA
jgi:hypothetical protein